MAYVVGFFAADGYITVNRRGGQFWCIQITDGELLKTIKKIIKADHKINVRKGLGNNQDLFRLQVGSIEMCDDLRTLGFTERKTKSLVVPNVPAKYFADFVRGYFDGDGNVWVGYTHKNRKSLTLSIMTAFTSCSVNFLQNLKSRLGHVGLIGGSVYQSKKNYARLQFSTNNSLKLYNFMYNHNAYQNNLFLSRKKLIFDRFIKVQAAVV